MTKADIVANIAEDTGLERVEVLKAVESFMNSVKSSLANGDNAVSYTHLTLPTILRV